MHQTVQPGSCSPKPMNGPTSTSTSQLKPGSDTIPNCASSIASQVKGKKRRQVDQGSEPVKPELSTKSEDGDYVNCRAEGILKSEIAKITEKGGLVDCEGVEKLVKLMVPQRSQRKIGLCGRSMLASVIAATDKLDCLNRFVQLKGLLVFDEWLQEVHRGKVGDGDSPKDSDKSIEEFLLVLLHALDKLPVYLDALQMCNIGKSVNHLRSHENMEIQKKARSLVDTWKKRVKTEMEAKSSSNPPVPLSARLCITEISHTADRDSRRASEVAGRNSVTQLSVSKAASAKLVQVDATTKCASTSLGSMRSAESPLSASTNPKVEQAQNANVDDASAIPLTTIRDEKSSSSCQSHGNSHSCSGEHANSRGLAGKEDAQSLTAGSVTVEKIVVGPLLQQKSVTDFPGTALSGVQREAWSGRISVNRDTTEKVLRSSLTCDKTFDGPLLEGTSQKLTVKIPNCGRSLVQSASGGSFDDSTVMNSSASSPVLSKKSDHFDHNLKDKDDAYRVNVASDVNNESWQSNDFIDVLTGSDEGDGSPTTVAEVECCRDGDDPKKFAEVSRAASSSSGNEQKSGKVSYACFSSINALVDSCANYSETNASVPAGDYVGMNLLASVAAEEMSKSDAISHTNYPHQNKLALDYSSKGHDLKFKSSAEDDLAQDRTLSTDCPHDQEKQLPISADSKTAFFSRGNPSGDLNRSSNSSNMDFQPTVLCPENDGMMKDTVAASTIAGHTVSSVRKASNGEVDKEPKEKRTGVDVGTEFGANAKLEVCGSLLKEDKISASSLYVQSGSVERLPLYRSLEDDGERKFFDKELTIMQAVHKSSAMLPDSETVEGHDERVLRYSCSGKHTNDADNFNEENVEDEVKAGSNISTSPKQANLENGNTRNRGERANNSLEGNGVSDLQNSGHAPPKQEAEHRVRSRGSKLTGSGKEEAEEATSVSADASSFSVTDITNAVAKVEFAPNEGFNADDAKYGVANNLLLPSCSVSIPFISSFPFAVSSVSNGLPSSITVAAPAKGPFVPPDDLLRSKGELGWKGSAATSAFRPAEPRKVLDMPLGSASISLLDPTIEKPSCHPLDFDLNVSDERIVEDLVCRFSAQDTGCPRALDLDLNRVDEPIEMHNNFTSSDHGVDVILPPHVKLSSSGFLSAERNTCRDFDLNDGPAVDEVSVEPSPFSLHTRITVPSQPPVPGLQMSNSDMGNISTWFSSSNNYPAVSIPPILPSREQPFPIISPCGPQRMVGPNDTSTPFNPDVHRGSVLSSSPAVPFPSTPFQYPLFPFGTSFPLPSATFSGSSTAHVDSSSGGSIWFPAMHPQLLGPAGAVPANYLRPYVVNLNDGNNCVGAETTRKRSRQGLDLNAGHFCADMEAREEMSSLAPRQPSVSSSQRQAEEWGQFFNIVDGSMLKRKEPEGGWDGYRQSGSRK